MSGSCPARRSASTYVCFVRNPLFRFRFLPGFCQSSLSHATTLALATTVLTAFAAATFATTASPPPPTGSCRCVQVPARHARKTYPKNLPSTTGGGFSKQGKNGPTTTTTSWHTFLCHRRAPGIPVGFCLASASRALPLYRPARVRVHAARMRASPPTRTCTHITATCAHTRQKHPVVPRVTGNWLAACRPAAEPLSAQLQRKCARQIPLLTSHVHHPHAVHPTTDVITVRRDMMTMIETKTNDTMKKTDNTMDDASECVSARACGSHAPWRMRTHDAKHCSAKQ